MRKTKKSKKKLSSAQYAQKVKTVMAISTKEEIKEEIKIVKNRFDSFANNKIIKRLVKINRFTWIWLVLILSVAIVHFLSAQTGESYSPDRLVDLVFDHQAAIQDIQSNLNSNDIRIRELKIINGNELQFRTTTNVVQVAKFEDSLKVNKSILQTNDFIVIPLNPIQTYYPEALGSVILFAILSFIAVIVTLRKNALGYRIKVWALLLILPLCFGLASAAGGVILSKLGIILLTKSSFELYVCLQVAFILVAIYLFNNPGYRQKLLRTFYTSL